MHSQYTEILRRVRLWQTLEGEVGCSRVSGVRFGEMSKSRVLRFD